MFDESKIEAAIERAREEFKVMVFADFSGKGMREGGARFGTDDVRVRVVPSFQHAMLAAASAYALGANEVLAVVSFPSPRGLFNEVESAARDAATGQQSPIGDNVSLFTARRADMR